MTVEFLYKNNANDELRIGKLSSFKYMFLIIRACQPYITHLYYKGIIFYRNLQNARVDKNAYMLKVYNKMEIFMALTLPFLYLFHIRKYA